jgi:hypothetical protein
MQDVDIRYTFLLLPLLYVSVPYFLTGNFIILGGVGAFAFISGIIIFVIISNLDVAGNIQVIIGTGGGGKIGLNSEGGYTLFVVFIGAIFYLGAQITQFFTPILDIFVGLMNGFLGVIGFLSGTNLGSISSKSVANLGINSNFTSLSNIYPTGKPFIIDGISVFLALDAIMASMFIVGLWLMVSSRGH